MRFGFVPAACTTAGAGIRVGMEAVYEKDR
jgi:hypothetical protein